MNLLFGHLRSGLDPKTELVSVYSNSNRMWKGVDGDKLLGHCISFRWTRAIAQVFNDFLYHLLKIFELSLCSLFLSCLLGFYFERSCHPASKTNMIPRAWEQIKSTFSEVLAVRIFWNTRITRRNTALKNCEIRETTQSPAVELTKGESHRNFWRD